jgi:hypothetical protein
LWLGVPERNERAISGYMHRGFRVLGEHVFMLGGDAQTDCCFVSILVDRSGLNTLLLLTAGGRQPPAPRHDWVSASAADERALDR